MGVTENWHGWFLVFLEVRSSRRWQVTSHELGAVVFLLGYGALLVGAIKVFGLRRVLLVVFGIVFVAIAVAFKSLGVVTGGRRY